MGFQDFISENEAASISGVSVQTLRRFAEAGYLKVERDSDGVPLFAKGELSQVFGITNTKAEDFIQATTAKPPASTETSSTASITPSQQPTVRPFEATPTTAVTSSTSEQKVEAAISIPQQAPASPAPERTAAMAMLEQEIVRLKHVVDLQEKVLTIREGEIADLKLQREWMKQRLERFEEKGERDQLLLLAETQTIRKLVSLQEQRKSPLQATLEWLGFRPVQAQATVVETSLVSSQGQHTARSTAHRAGSTRSNAQKQQDNDTDNHSAKAA